MAEGSKDTPQRRCSNLSPILAKHKTFLQACVNQHDYSCNDFTQIQTIRWIVVHKYKINTNLQIKHKHHYASHKTPSSSINFMRLLSSVFVKPICFWSMGGTQWKADCTVGDGSSPPWAKWTLWMRKVIPLEVTLIARLNADKVPPGATRDL